MKTIQANYYFARVSRSPRKGMLRVGKNQLKLAFFRCDTGLSAANAFS